MTGTWTEPVYVLASRTPATMGGLWSLLQTAAVAASELALLPGLDDDLSLTLASADLQEAARDLEWAHPSFPRIGVVLDIGTAPLDDIHGCRTSLAALIHAASRTTAGLLGQRDLPMADLLTLVRVLPLVSAAQARVGGDRRD